MVSNLQEEPNPVEDADQMLLQSLLKRLPVL